MSGDLLPVKSWCARSAAAIICAVLLFGSIPASAQMLHLDPIPWTVTADSTAGPSLIIEASRFEDSKFGWAADRLLLTLLLPSGRDVEYFVRVPHITFDSGDIPLFGRWPWIQGEAEIDDFWQERRTSSFGQIEAGGTRRAHWPWFGRFLYGGSVGLPVGTDRLYPVSSVSFPLRAEAKKVFEIGPSSRFEFDLGLLYNIASGADRLDDDAFPNGWHWGVAWNVGGDRGRNLRLDYDDQNRDGRMSKKLGAQLGIPWTDQGSWGLRVERELAGSLDRFAAWHFALVWRFDHRTEPEAPLVPAVEAGKEAPAESVEVVPEASEEVLPEPEPATTEADDPDLPR